MEEQAPSDAALKLGDRFLRQLDKMYPEATEEVMVTEVSPSGERLKLLNLHGGVVWIRRGSEMLIEHLPPKPLLYFHTPGLWTQDPK